MNASSASACPFVPVVSSENTNACTSVAGAIVRLAGCAGILANTYEVPLTLVAAGVTARLVLGESGVDARSQAVARQAIATNVTTKVSRFICASSRVQLS